MGILTKVLFSVGGQAISVKTILKLLLVILFFVMAWVAYDRVKDHFQHIRDLEAQNEQLLTDKTVLQQNLDEVVRINEQNVAMWEAEREANRQTAAIATAEVQHAATREAKTKEVQDEIDKSPSTSTAVDPVISRTLDRLWR